MLTAALQNVQAEQTKRKVRNVALKLFNENGSRNVTIPDIAQAAGVNLLEVYDLFKNKEAIIRDIFFEIDVFSIEKWWSHSSLNSGFSDFMRFYFGSMARYRFFFCEFSTLLNDDPLLAKEWKSTYDRLFHVMREVLKIWVKQGLMKPFTTLRETDLFIESIWILAMFSGVHLGSHCLQNSGTTSDSSLNQILIHYLWPYHTEKGRRVLRLYS